MVKSEIPHITSTYKIFPLPETHFQVIIHTYLAEISLKMCFTAKQICNLVGYIFQQLYETRNTATEKGPTYKDISVQHIPQR